MSTEVNLEPTPTGYRRMAEIIWFNLTSFLQAGKTERGRMAIRSLIELAVYLSHNHPDEYNRLMNPLSSKEK
jgi:hypothetical protein